MGVHVGITATSFPRQGSHLGKRVKVCFHYDTSQWIFGVVVRDDVEDPGITIIRLDDERPPVLGTECQYSIVDERQEGGA